MTGRRLRPRAARRRRGGEHGRSGHHTAAIAGVSLGGMMAVQLAPDHPDRVSALALISTSAAMDAAGWSARIETVRTRAPRRSPTWRSAGSSRCTTHPDIPIADGMKRAIAAQSDAGYAGAGAPIRDMALADRVGTIRVPALVVTGDADVSTPFEGHGDRLMAALANARHVALASAHLPPIEAPAALAASLRHFLLPDTAGDEAAETLFEAGLRDRRRVPGDAWVDRSLANRTPFNADFQAMMTRIAWHESGAARGATTGRVACW